jgi:hypothetical protein
MSSALSARSRPSRANRSCNTPNADRLNEDDGLFQKASFLTSKNYSYMNVCMPRGSPNHGRETAVTAATPSRLTVRFPY